MRILDHWRQFVSLAAIACVTAGPLRAEDRLILPPLPDVPSVADPAPRLPSDPLATGTIAAVDPATPASPTALPVAPAPDPVAPAIPETPPVSPAAMPGDAAPAPTLSPLQTAFKAQTDSLVAQPRRTTEIRKEREAVAAFYAARAFKPVWRSGDEWTAGARAALVRLQRADEDGLDLKLVLPTLPATTEIAAVAAADVALSEAVVAYGRQAGGARVDPRLLSPLIGDRPDPADPAAILAAVSVAADPDATLEAYNPPHEAYRALRGKLAELRRENPAVARIQGGPELVVGMSDPRVKLIRARFGLGPIDADTPDALVYDTRVADAVAGFQRAHRIPASGTLTPRTIAALSGGDPSRLQADILVNMERWRWMPRDLGDTRIEVNIPDYSLNVIRDGVVAHHARVVVGKPTNQTPIFSKDMRYIVVNPSWNVPESIIKKEMMPHLANDPDYLTRQGYEVTYKGNRMIVRQPPGEKNALGHIKFLFPNDYAVYLHDTPSRSLFAAEKRAFSHGCVRVDQPLALAEMVLGPAWTQERFKKLIGGDERTITLAKPMPVHIEYFTATVDESGKLQLRDDLYGHDSKLRQALGLGA